MHYENNHHAKHSFYNHRWTSIPKTEHKGEHSKSNWQTIQFNGFRIRLVEYLPGYLADHWCEKGHVVC